MSLHDAGLAARYADDALLLAGDGGWSFAPASEVLDEASIGRLYGIPCASCAGSTAAPSSHVRTTHWSA